MRHPTEGTLRRLLDEPAAVGDAEREHVAGCPVCLSGLAAAQSDAAVTGAALNVAVSTDVDAGWRRLSGEVAAEGASRAAAANPARPWRAAVRSPIIAAVGVLALLVGGSAAAAGGWLQIFRAEQVAPVSVTQADLVELPDLSAYGDVDVAKLSDVREVADEAAVERVTGLSVPQVGALPQGVTGEPTLQVGGRMSAVFTFSAKKAAQAAEAAGESLPPVPSGLDGARFRLSAGPGVAAIWQEARGVPAMVVARGVAPTAYSSGVSFETARDYLLSLPGLPENVASQLRGFSGDGTTLPIPVPAERMTSSEVEVGGAPATLLTSRDGTMAGVVWVQDGEVTAVAGLLSADEVLSVAGELR